MGDDSHHLSLEADDSSFRDGLSKKGMTVGFSKKGAFDMHYGLDGDAPKFSFKTSATVLANFGSPDLKALTVAAKYCHNGDTSIEPSYCMGTESLAVTVEHRLDGDNSLTAKYDQGSNVGSLEC